MATVSLSDLDRRHSMVHHSTVVVVGCFLWDFFEMFWLGRPKGIDALDSSVTVHVKRCLAAWQILALCVPPPTSSRSTTTFRVYLCPIFYLNPCRGRPTKKSLLFFFWPSFAFADTVNRSPTPSDASMDGKIMFDSTFFTFLRIWLFLQCHWSQATTGSLCPYRVRFWRVSALMPQFHLSISSWHFFSEVVESSPTKKVKKSTPGGPAFRAQSAVTVTWVSCSLGGAYVDPF